MPAKGSLLAFFKLNVLPALACVLAALALMQTPWFARVENLTRDELTRLRARLKPATVSDAVVLIGIDESSLRTFGRWPWRRRLHGELLQLTGLQSPKVSAWDILFTEPSEQPGDDAAMAKGARRGAAGAVVLGAMTVQADEGIKPGSPPAQASHLRALPRVLGDPAQIMTAPEMLLPVGPLAQVAEIGFVDTPPERDGVRRSVPLVVRVGDQVYPTLALRSLMAYWNVEPAQVVVRLGEAIELKGELADRRIPIDAAGRYRINFRHEAEDFVTVGYDRAYVDLMARYQKKPGRIPLVFGRILLVGQVAEGLTDMGPTPFSPLTPLVLIHANVIDNILQEDYVRPVPEAIIWGGAFVVGVVGLMRFSRRKLTEQAAVAFGLPVAYGMASTMLWVGGSWVLPLVGPLLAFCSLQGYMIGRRVLQEQRAKDQIKGMFGTYVSPALVHRMINSGEMPRLGGYEEDITAYFSDIQSFSTFSEMLPPERLVTLMNEYLTACTDIVQEEGGTLDKYIGDAVVAMFGAPIALPDHAYRACVTALRVQQRLGELRAQWQAEGDKWPAVVKQMQSRIGLNSGSAVVGNMGSRTRFNYTMMGDTVNLAARMESGAKSWGTYAMCTEATKLACEKCGGDRVVFRPLGRIVVKGRSQAVPIFEIAGLKETLPAPTRECLALFSQALEKYYARDWLGARALFEQARALEPNVPGRTPGVVSNPSLVYLDIVAHFQASPPAADWDGVYVMKEK